MVFLTIFYKYIIQQYFTVATPHSVFSQYIKQIKYQMLVVVHPQSDENVRLRTSLCLLAIFKIKYQMLVVVHPQSDET